MSASWRVLVSAAALALLAGCGSSPEDQVRSTLHGFADATAKRDYQALCDDYFSPALVDQVEQAGLPCEAAIRPEISATQKPKLDIRSSTSTATARSRRSTPRPRTSLRPTTRSSC